MKKEFNVPVFMAVLAIIISIIAFSYIGWLLGRTDYEIKPSTADRISATDTLVDYSDLNRSRGQIEAQKVAIWQDNFSIDVPMAEKYVEPAVITAYCPCPKCCGKWSCYYTGGDPITATGTIATAGRTCGADPKLLPYGTHVWIDGNEYTVEDTGSGLTKGMIHIDIYCNTHQEAINVGRSVREILWEVPV